MQASGPKFLPLNMFSKGPLTVLGALAEAEAQSQSSDESVHSATQTLRGGKRTQCTIPPHKASARSLRSCETVGENHTFSTLC